MLPIRESGAFVKEHDDLEVAFTHSYFHLSLMVILMVFSRVLNRPSLLWYTVRFWKRGLKSDCVFRQAGCAKGTGTWKMIMHDA
jgi:hypothetical protein